MRKWIVVLLISLMVLTAVVSAAKVVPAEKKILAPPPEDSKAENDQTITDTALTGWAWYMTPGVDAVVQTPSNFNSLTYYAWGADGIMKPGMGTWIHIPVQNTNGGSVYARYVGVYFYGGSADVGVSQIDVWDGATKVKHFTGSWNGPGYKTVTLDLGSNRQFTRGMTISMWTGAGVESMDHRFIVVNGGGRYYVP